MWTTGGDCNEDLPDVDPTVYNHPCLQPNQIEDRLFLSSAYTEAAPVEILQRHGITHILQVGYELQPHHPGIFAYSSVKIADRFDQDIVQCLPGAFQFISQGMQDGKVLVHCVHGQSRSASVVIAYLMWRDGKPYTECLAAVKACRPSVKPNDGFEMQLCLLQELGFDRWPGWNAETFIGVRQQQLAAQQQQQQQQLGLSCSKQVSSAFSQQQQQEQQHLALYSQPQQQQQLFSAQQQHSQLQSEQLPAAQHNLLQQPQQQLQQQPQQQLQQQPQQRQQARYAAASSDLDHQDLVILASTSQLPEVCSNLACGCSKTCGCGGTGAFAAQTSGRGQTLQVDVDVDMQQQPQLKRKHMLQPACCSIM